MLKKLKNPLRLTFPAPFREPVRTENGWCSKPWTMYGVLKTLLNGGWFATNEGRYSFEPGVRDWTEQAQESLRGI